MLTEDRLEEGKDVARRLGNGVIYNGPWMDGDEFFGHVFTDAAVTGSTFMCNDLEGCKARLAQVRKEFGAAPPTWLPSTDIYQGMSAHPGPDPKILAQYPGRDGYSVRKWWDETYGSQYVIRTNGDLDAIVKHLGYESITVPEEVMAKVSGVIPTDFDIVNQSQKRLSQVQILPDSSLTTKQRVHLALAREVAREVVQGSPPQSIKGAMIPPASDRVRTAGMYARTSREIFITPEQLESGRTTIDTTLHELAHHTSGSEDGEGAHNRELTKLGGMIVQRTAQGTFDDIVKKPEFRW